MRIIAAQKQGDVQAQHKIELQNPNPTKPL